MVTGVFISRDEEAKRRVGAMATSGPLEALSVEDRLRLMGRFMYALDETNIRIIRLMHRLGPRNLLEVARAAGLPPTSAYDRARKLEEKFGVLARASLDHSKLALRKCITLAESTPGMEEFVTEALAVPNYWKTIVRCEGGFTHYALHAIPDNRADEFETYVSQVQRAGLLRRSETIWVSDYYYLFPNFELYDPANRAWSFEWEDWSEAIKDKRHPKAICDPTEYTNHADRTDLLILSQFEMNARVRFSQISKFLGITLQAVKHRYDNRIVPRGLIRDFLINVLPYPPELSDLYELLITFEDEEGMNAFFGASEKMFPIQRVMKVLGENKLSLRTYSPRSETERLFGVISNLARSGLISDYSAVRIRPEAQTGQTISPELFDNKLGWRYELSQHLAALDAIVEHAKVNV